MISVRYYSVWILAGASVFAWHFTPISRSLLWTMTNFSILSWKLISIADDEDVIPPILFRTTSTSTTPSFHFLTFSKMNLLMPGGSSETLLDAGHFDFILDEFIGTNNNHHHHHQCHLCPQRFNTKLEFKSHLKHHGQQKQFQCQHCCSSNKSKQTADNSVGKHSSYYLTSTKLWSHMSRSHFKTTECFYCSLCDNKPFKQAFNYHLHMLIHTGEQPHVCPTCSKAFRTKPSLRKHELIHTGMLLSHFLQ